MKLIRFGAKGSEKPGVILNGRRRDCAARFDDWDHDFLQNGGLKKLENYIGEYGHELPEVPGNERWASPVSRPGMILCVGLNYVDHAKESGMELPAEPILFMKASNTLQGPYDDVGIPKNGHKTDWEVELAVVVGRDSLYLHDVEEAMEAIAGYSIINDLSERHFQLERGGQWVKGKSCPGFSPLGPFLATRDEINDVNSLRMNLSVNGQEMQKSHTGNMAFTPAFLVWYTSQFMKIEAGDIIATGTPPGVGLGLHPPRYLVPGDMVELAIEGLGSQGQRFTGDRS